MSNNKDLNKQKSATDPTSVDMNAVMAAVKRLSPKDRETLLANLSAKLASSEAERKQPLKSPAPAAQNAVTKAQPSSVTHTEARVEARVEASKKDKQTAVATAPARKQPQPKVAAQAKSYQKPKKTDSFPIELGCLELIKDFGIVDQVTITVLTEIAKAARHGGGRGIPTFESPDTYLVRPRGGPKTATRRCIIDDEEHIIQPPPWVRPEGDVSLMWVEFEKVLLGIQEAETSQAEANKLQTTIGFDRRVKAAGISWVEGRLDDTEKLGLPTISAATARHYLRDNFAISDADPEFIDLAVASWLTETGEWTEEFRCLMRDIWYDRVAFGRLERFCLARLLMVPLGQIELIISQIAFPEESEDKSYAEAIKKAQATNTKNGRPRGRPKGATKAKANANSNTSSTGGDGSNGGSVIVKPHLASSPDADGVASLLMA